MDLTFSFVRAEGRRHYFEADDYGCALMFVGILENLISLSLASEDF